MSKYSKPLKELIVVQIQSRLFFLDFLVVQNRNWLFFNLLNKLSNQEIIGKLLCAICPQYLYFVVLLFTWFYIISFHVVRHEHCGTNNCLKNIVLLWFYNFLCLEYQLFLTKPSFRGRKPSISFIWESPPFTIRYSWRKKISHFDGSFRSIQTSHNPTAENLKGFPPLFLWQYSNYKKSMRHYTRLSNMRTNRHNNFIVSKTIHELVLSFNHNRSN